MAIEKDKYRAQFFQIGAFALMTPLASVIMDLKNISWEDINIRFFLFSSLSLILFVCGMIAATFGIIYLEEKGK